MFFIIIVAGDFDKWLLCNICKKSYHWFCGTEASLGRNIKDVWLCNGCLPTHVETLEQEADRKRQQAAERQQRQRKAQRGRKMWY